MSKIKKIILKKINKKNSKQNIIKIKKIGNRILDKNLFYINNYLI